EDDPGKSACGSEELLGLVEPALRGRVVGVAADLGELLQNLALLGAEALRGLDVHADKLGALGTSAQRRHALAAQAEGGAALGAGGGLQRAFAEKRGHLDRAAEGGEGELDRDLAEEVVAVALEEFVFLDLEHDVEVAGLTAGEAGLAVAGGTEARTGIDTGGDAHGELGGLGRAAFAVAGVAGLFDFLAGAA